MLESSAAHLAEASNEDKTMAEILAFAHMKCELEEDLIPPAEAAKTAEEHRGANTEEWARAMHSALRGMAALRGAGFTLAKG